MLPDLPQHVTYILDTLEKHGHEAWIVGGCVRDFLLGRPPHDWDITTSALPEEVKACFRRTYDTGIAHGTVTVVLDNLHYEVTTYRIDGAYLDGRHPENVAFTKNLTEDLLRRDFTMNAIAYHPHHGFADPFDGREDIALGLIRGVGDPAKRFQEDALRMLRAIRFSAQLGFSIEPVTYQALLENAPLIKQISGERMREETEKLLLCPYTDKVPLLWETGLVADIPYPAKETLCPALSRAEKIPALRWALLLQQLNAKERKALFARFKFDNKTAKAVDTILENKELTLSASQVFVRRLSSRLGIEHCRLLLQFFQSIETPLSHEALETLSHIVTENHPLFIKDLALNGEDLATLGVPKGKTMGETLTRLLDLVLENPEKNTAEHLKTYLP